MEGMSIFTVVIEKPSPEFGKRVASLYKDHHPIVDGLVWFIRSAQNVNVADIANQLGMSSEKGIRGVVIKNNSSYGYFDRALWLWEQKGE